MRLGQEVRFINPTKYDNLTHRVLHISEDRGVFLHYWYWVDEDELEIVD